MQLEIIMYKDNLFDHKTIPPRKPKFNKITKLVVLSIWLYFVFYMFHHIV